MTTCIHENSTIVKCNYIVQLQNLTIRQVVHSPSPLGLVQLLIISFCSTNLLYCSCIVALTVALFPSSFQPCGRQEVISSLLVFPIVDLQQETKLTIRLLLYPFTLGQGKREKRASNGHAVTSSVK